MKSILDPSFRYTASFNTDLHKAFARIWRDYSARSGEGSTRDHGPARQPFVDRWKDSDEPVKAFVSASLPIDNH
jgi:hypothetical protein